ncbi:hypothetical protein [Microbacterium karelineae]|uniref:hypothetical protein n=1 Tax=Microbacterium karelineae TaxID=2654283 RepID=UPI0012EB0177|nr:hypothetical protein [Microbacterium karelineae]
MSDRLRFVLPAAAIAVLALAGCSGEDPDPTPTFTSGPQPVATPTPDAEDGATADPSAAEPAEWIISPDGIGPISLGMPLEAVAETFGGEVVDHFPDGESENTCQSVESDLEGLTGDIVVAGDDGSAQSIQWRPLSWEQRTDPETPMPRTEDGVTLGMLEAQVEDIWGPVTHEEWGSGGLATWLLDDGSHHLGVLTNRASYTPEGASSWVVNVLVFADDGSEYVFPSCFD